MSIEKLEKKKEALLGSLERKELDSIHKIVTSMPLVGLFGTDSDDEFSISYNGKRLGVFKVFEFPSLLISRSSSQAKAIIEKAIANNTAFANALEGTQELSELKSALSVLVEKPNYSLQLFRDRLSKAFMIDTSLADIFKGISGSGLEFELAKFIYAWNKLEDFYCIEGLVGGTGAYNPFGKVNGSVQSDDNIDTIDDLLPFAYANASETERKAMLLQLASIAEREPADIGSAIDVLGQINKGKYTQADSELIGEAKEKIAGMVNTRHDTAKSVARFINSVLRFNNWLPQLDGAGSMYDSVCKPASSALEIVKQQGRLDIADMVSQIKDATSPKGVALVRLVLMGEIGDPNRLASELDRIGSIADKELDRVLLDKFSVIDASSKVFYESLTGGKWKGIKQLAMFKELFGSKFEIPAGFVVSSLAIRDILEKEGIMDIIERNKFKFSDSDRQEVLRILDRVDFAKHLEGRLASRLEPMQNSLIARSSMDFEDGRWTFSGTYDSVSASKSEICKAIGKVVKSWFSAEAVKDRELIGMAHIPNIAVIVQEKIDCDYAGVINIVGGRVSISVAKTPDEAVGGMGSAHSSNSIAEAMSHLGLARFAPDFEQLHKVFGDIDIEFGVKGDRLYVFQARPKISAKEPQSVSSKENGKDIPTVVVNSIEELGELKLERLSKVRLAFLDGHENVMDRSSAIMEFIRNNASNIYWVEASMPAVAHIPNKIEGFFGIRYKQISGEMPLRE